MIVGAAGCRCRSLERREGARRRENGSDGEREPEKGGERERGVEAGQRSGSCSSRSKMERSKGGLN